MVKHKQCVCDVLNNYDCKAYHKNLYFNFKIYCKDIYPGKVNTDHMSEMHVLYSDTVLHVKPGGKCVLPFQSTNFRERFEMLLNPAKHACFIKHS